MILGVVLLVSVSFLSQLAGMSRHDRELLNCMLTYCLLASLTTTSIFNMTATRYVSDMLYEEKPERIIPSLYGSTSILLVGGCLIWAVFLHFSGVLMVYKLLCLWFYAILIVVWMEMNYLTALKDYKVLVRDFAISLACGLLLALLMVLDGQEALSLADASVDLYILDVNMPKLSGFGAAGRASGNIIMRRSCS